MSLEKIKHIKVRLEFAPHLNFVVGDMLLSEGGEIYFQFEPSFLARNIPISPFKLKNQIEPQTPRPNDAQIFSGLFGVFADSLPDGWGLLLMSRSMRKYGMSYQTSSALDRLSFIGQRAMGALTYEPVLEHSEQDTSKTIDLSQLASAVSKVLEGSTEDVLPELLELGGSPAGARPKVLVAVDTSKKGKKRMIAGVDNVPPGFEHWLIKFHGKDEAAEAGVVEYIYMKVAEHVGLKTEQVHLFEDNKKNLWFGTRRFDRGPQGQRTHVHTLAGLLHANFRLPALDYEAFLHTTYILTKNRIDLSSAFRLMVFNVVFHNRDDHAKNFAYVLSQDGVWHLSPAYDLNYSEGPGGEHTTSILGEGRSPTRDRILKLGVKFGIENANSILQEVEEGRVLMKDLLRQYGITGHSLGKLP